MTTYYPDKVPTLHNLVSRYNVDELNNDPKLKLFKCPGGKAGKGALIGAGTNVIGGALFDSLLGGGSSQPQPQPVYVQQAPQYQQSGYSSSGSTQPHKKIIRKYDSDGKVISEEEVWE